MAGGGALFVPLFVDCLSNCLPLWSGGTEHTSCGQWTHRKRDATNSPSGHVIGRMWDMTMSLHPSIHDPFSFSYFPLSFFIPSNRPNGSNSLPILRRRGAHPPPQPQPLNHRHRPSRMSSPVNSWRHAFQWLQSRAFSFRYQESPQF